MGSWYSFNNLIFFFLNKLKSVISVALLSMVSGHGLGEFSLSVPDLFCMILLQADRVLVLN